MLQPTFELSNKQELTVALVKERKLALLEKEKTQFLQKNVDEWIALHTQFCDALLKTLWTQFELNTPSLALFAVGGYGREEMFPHSDLDLLLLSSMPLTEEKKEKISAFLQFLWDCGFKVGASVRTLQECETLAKADITIATNLLERRFLSGDEELKTPLSEILQQADFWPRQDYFAGKVAEQKKRYARFQNTSYNLEPDLKYSPGGLRDLHLLYWLALRETGAKNLEQLLSKNWIDEEEYRELKQSQQFLFQLRFALHLLSKRDDNRLLFERQKQLCEFLMFNQDTTTPNAGVEAMMKRFFQSVQFLSVFRQILLQHYAQSMQESTGALQKTEKLDEHFVIQDNWLMLVNPQCFQRTPSCILDVFLHLTRQTQLQIHPDTLRLLLKISQQYSGYLCDDPLAREKFLQLLQQKNAIRRGVLPMHRYGILKIYLPQWQHIQGLMQFDLFHNYTVDEHILRVMLNIETFTQNEQEHFPLLQPIFQQILKGDMQTQTRLRMMLSVSALFHDIAKGQGGDHSELGSQALQAFAQMHHFSAQETQTMCYLVANHLLFSMTAQRRDIQDPSVIQTFAQKVETPQRLDLLLMLTVADICATNSHLWNRWKATLLHTLYQNTLRQFKQGTHLALDPQKRIQSHRQEAMQRLTAYSKEEIQQYWQRLPDDYFLRHQPAQIAWHTKLLLQNPKQKLLVAVSHRYAKGGTEIFIHCHDQPHLFYNVVSLLDSKQYSIHDAQIITSDNGEVFDSFIISEKNGALVGEMRQRQLEKVLMQALEKPTQLKKTPVIQKKVPFSVPTEVRFIRNKKQQTEFELCTLDRKGLLTQIGQVFIDQNLNLSAAKISTIGEKAQDFFILTNQENLPLSLKEKSALRKALVDALD